MKTAKRILQVFILIFHWWSIGESIGFTPSLKCLKISKKEGFQVLWEAIETEDKGSIAMEGMKRTDEMIFTAKLYNKMTDEVEVYVDYKNEKLPLFADSDQKEAFRVSLYDFYRMTGLL